MRKSVGAIIPLFLSALVGCGRGDHAPQARTEPAVRAAVETVALAPVNETYEAVGTVQSRITSTLATRILGNVAAVLVSPGDTVEAGQVVVQISDTDLVAQVARAKAGLVEAENAAQEAESAERAAQSAIASATATRELAEANFKRWSALVEKHAVSQVEFDEMRMKQKTAQAEFDRAEQMLQSAQSRRKQAAAKIEQAKADIVNAEAQLAYTRIVAPAAGIVTMRSVDPGSFVSPGTPLLRIEDHRRYRLEALVEEAQLGRVKLGSEARVTIDALAGAPLTAKVGEIVPAADPRSRSFLVKLDLPEDARLRPGLFGRASFAIGRRDGITLPANAVVERGQLTAVYVLDAANIARLRLVRTGRAFGARVEILSGLNPNERVVVDHLESVREGARVAP